MEQQIDKLAQSVANLVSPPAVALELSRRLNDPDIAPDQIAALIESDPKLTVAILRIANSAHISRGRTIVNVDKAVIRLGSGLVQEIALGLCVARAFSGLPARAELVVSFWRHSVYTAVAARYLANFAEIDHRDAAYTAGLLHDIGELVIYSKLVGASAHILEAWSANQDRPRHEFEYDFLGFNHMQLGTVLAEQWNLPKILITCIKAHHDPARHVYCPRLVHAVEIADSIAFMAELEQGYCEYVPLVHAEAWSALNIDEDIIPEVLDEVRNHSQEMLSVFSRVSLAAA